MLVGHWPLIGNTNDYSGFNNNGTPTSITYTTGKIGQAALMNAGTIVMPTAATSTYTFAFWIKLKSGFTGNFRKFFQQSSNRSPGFWFLHTSNGLHLRQVLSNDTNAGTDTSPLTVGVWTHVVHMCFPNGTGGTRIQTYLNGVLNANNNFTGTPVMTGTTLDLLAADYDINDFRLYNSQLSEYEIKELAKAKIIHYTFDNTDEIIGARDVSGFNNNGTLYSGATVTSSSDGRIGGRSMEFNGTGGFFSPPFTLDNYTISFWANRDSANTMSVGSNGATTNFTFYWYGDNSWRYVHGGTGQEYYYNAHPNYALTPIPNGTWGHFAVVYNGSNVTIYRNGVQHGSQSSTGSAVFSPGISFGYGLTYSWFDGKIDDARVYATPLSETDVLALYNRRANFDNLGNVSANELNEYQEPIISDGLILNLDANNKNSISAIGCTGFNNAPQLVRSTVNTSTYTITTDANIRLGNLDYYTVFAIDAPESSYGGDAVSRHGITPGFNVRSGTKLYDASRALHLWVFNNSTNTWLPSSYFNGSRLSGHCYDTWTGFANWPVELAQFVTDYNNIKAQFKNCTYIVMGSHRDSGHSTDKFNILLELGAPSNVSSLLGGAPEYILIGEPGLGPNNAYSWAYENYTTDPTRVAHTNFGLPVFGRKGNYFDISLSTNFISVADNALLDIVGDKTLACWIYMGADSSGSGIVAKANGTVNGMALAYGWSSNGFQGIAWNSSNTPAIAKDISRDIQKWCYLTVTQSGSTRTIYVYDEQGLRTANSTTGVHTWNNTLPLYIGADSNGTNRVPNGTRIAMVSVYNRALSAGEVLTNFNNTKTNYYNDGNKNTINSLGQALYSDFVEDELLASGVKQAITNNGSLVIDGEFSEVD
jgi:hypothetical protein